MLRRQTTGSVVCPSCGRLVGVNDERCFSCGRWNPGLWGYSQVLGKLGQDLAFPQMVLGGCVALFVATLLLSKVAIGGGGLFSILSPNNAALLRFGASGSIPVFGLDRWWTVVSAAWLHGGLLHILFNMLWVRQLAPAVAQLYGPARLVIIYVVGGTAGFVATSCVGLLNLPGPLAGAPLTVGASAPLFALFGALVVYGRRTGNRSVTQQSLYYVVVLGLFGLLVGFVDNWAHAGGFAGGYLVARWLDPMLEEGQGHWLGALVCLLVVVFSLALSLLVPLPPGLFGR